MPRSSPKSESGRETAISLFSGVSVSIKCSGLIFIVDIDGTICETINGDYAHSVPMKKRIKKINKLYDKYNEIIYFTARGTETGKDWRKLTEKQFKEWGVLYDKLLFGKPYGDIYYDDRAVNAKFI